MKPTTIWMLSLTLVLNAPMAHLLLLTLKAPVLAKVVTITAKLAVQVLPPALVVLLEVTWLETRPAKLVMT